MGVSVLLKNAAERNEKILRAVSYICKLTNLMTDRSMLNSLKRRIRQQKGTFKALLHRQDNEIPKVYCMNSSALTWDDALLSLIELQNGNDENFKTVHHLLKIDKIILLGTLLSETAMVSMEELRFYLPIRLRKHVSNPLLRQLSICFPL